MSATGKARKDGGNLPTFTKSLVQEHGARVSGWREMTSGPFRVRVPFAFGGKKTLTWGGYPKKQALEQGRWGARTKENVLQLNSRPQWSGNRVPHVLGG